MAQSRIQDFAEQEMFEKEVRRVAEAVWKLEPGECQPEHYSNDPVISELDGLVRLRDVSHLLMATVSTSLDKAKDDVKKLAAAEKLEPKDGRAVHKWFITSKQLNALHVKYCRERGVTALPLELFKLRFFNGREYISKRRAAAFGSARNVSDNSVNFPDNEYVPLPLTVVANQSGRIEKPFLLSFEKFIEEINSGKVVVLIAPFGSGKSLTVREVFLRLAKTHNKDGVSKVPISVNLRDHWGARYGDEVLERHAREIGFAPKEDVVVAWRAGLSTLLLDGFDEVATQVVARSSDRNFMRNARLEALRAVQDIFSKIPAGSGVLVAGRDHYFDSSRDLQLALGLGDRQFILVELGEFGEDEASIYLKKKGVDLSLPGWLPRKPLILSYLASRDLLDQVVQIDGNQGFGFAWNEFLARICTREAGQGRSAMDDGVLRHLMERIAFDCRATAQGNGPIAERDLAEAYLLETGENPGEAVLMHLQRLPGLSARGHDAGLRSFIDLDMLSALQGGALARFILEGVQAWSKRAMLSPMTQQAIQMAAYQLKKVDAVAGLAITTAVRVAANSGASGLDIQIAADCFETALAVLEDEVIIDCQGLVLFSAYIGTLSLEGIELINLTLEECQIDEVILDEVGLKSNIRMIRCDIQKVSGIPSREAMPQNLFLDCTVEAFDSLSTNASIIRSNLPVKLKALLTILRKLYRQAGAGRKLNAFKRGIPPGPIMDCIDEVIRLLATEGLLYVERGIAHQVRKSASRARRLLALAGGSEDPLVKQLLGMRPGDSLGVNQ